MTTLTATHATITQNREHAIVLNLADSAAILSATIVDGTSMQEHAEATWTSNGYNIESPGDTCGFGPLETYALLPGSVTIDTFPRAQCTVDTDQRGEPRPETGGDACDM